MKLRCPVCRSKRVQRCLCDPFCPYRQCLACLHEGHRMEFRAMAKIPVISQDRIPNPAQGTHAFWPEDDELREAKPPFVIEERWHGRAAKWRRFIKGHWLTYLHTEALKIARAERMPC